MLGDESNSSSLPSWVVAVGEVQDGRRGQRASRTTSGAVLGGDGGRGGQGMEALQGVPQGDAGSQSLGLGAAQLEAEAGGPASEASSGGAGGQHQAGGGGGGGAGGEEEAGEGRGAKRRRGGSGPMLQVWSCGWMECPDIMEPPDAVQSKRCPPDPAPTAISSSQGACSHITTLCP